MLTCWQALAALPLLLAESGAEQHWLRQAIESFCRQFPDSTFFNLPWNVTGLLAIILVSVSCGAVGSLVVGNRMAFFSDALAHCAFAGVSLGFLFFYAFLAGVRPDDEFWQWATAVMVGFGIFVGLGIAYVRDKTGQSSDTVIGVFFAGAMGLAAMLRQLIRSRKLFNMEDFLFGDPLVVQAQDLLLLLFLTAVTAGLLTWMYNRFVFTSFHISLAHSRRIPVGVCNYLFIILLALLVNLCLRAVGALLINALLIVPAATARNLARNMRQLFWLTILLCLFAGIAGQLLSWGGTIPRPGGEPSNPIRFGISGTIVMLSVVLFFLSMLREPLAKMLVRMLASQGR